MSKVKCIGQWCPKSLEAINTPGFILRAGVLPYIPATIAREARFLVGVKDGEYTDFGGGCKIKKKEKPFECAARELTEEILGVFKVHPKNITHILITGKARPHQIVMLIRVDDFPEGLEGDFDVARAGVLVRDESSGRVAKPELERIEVLTATELSRARKISDSLKSTKSDILRLTRK